ncbi:hypothetical protein CHISP_2574 [Chitinispirillum alkaliphilum]|nr:hypothetical protein CHISP_2574 [Chitinispirillum alkaliphilum]
MVAKDVLSVFCSAHTESRFYIGIPIARIEVFLILIQKTEQEPFDSGGPSLSVSGRGKEPEDRNIPSVISIQAG